MNIKYLDLEVVNFKVFKRAVGWCETVDNIIELVQGVANFSR